MKRPYFPDPAKPKEASPYRESQPKPAVATGEQPAVVVSRPEPLAEEEPPLAPRWAPATKTPSAELTQMEARALLAVDRNQSIQYFRTRILVVPITLVLWRYGRVLGVVHWLVYPLLAVSLALVVLEIKRIWRRTEL